MRYPNALLSDPPCTQVPRTHTLAPHAHFSPQCHITTSTIRHNPPDFRAERLPSETLVASQLPLEPPSDSFLCALKSNATETAGEDATDQTAVKYEALSFIVN